MTEFTEEDLALMDLDKSGSIDVKELRAFFEVENVVAVVV